MDITWHHMHSMMEAFPDSSHYFEVLWCGHRRVEFILVFGRQYDTARKASVQPSHNYIAALQEH